MTRPLLATGLAAALLGGPISTPWLNAEAAAAGSGDRSGAASAAAQPGAAAGRLSDRGRPGGTAAAAAPTPKPASGELTSPAQPPPAARPAPVILVRPQTVAPLSGGLDQVPLINDNNPELIQAPGILLSTFDPARGWNGQALPQPSAHLDSPLNGPFGLFSHHVYAGKPASLDSTLWLAVVAAPRGRQPVHLRLVQGSTALSQSVDGREPAAPFLPLPPLLEQGGTPIWAGPGSRVATELLRRERSPQLPQSWTLVPGELSTLLVLPIPVRGLDPLLNGRNLHLRLQSDAALDLATLAAFGPDDQPPPPAVWAQLLRGELSPREHAPTPRDAPGRIVYSRVSGIQPGSLWRSRLSDPGQDSLAVSRAPISWPIASLVRGSLGSGQVQTAPLGPFYPGTAWAAHGNYGVEYDLSLPLRNDTGRRVSLRLAFESPLKGDQPGGLRFLASPGPGVTFRGTVEVSGLDEAGRAEGRNGRPAGRRSFHVVLRNGQGDLTLGRISLDPGQRRELRVRLIYPADSTPPQVLSLLPSQPDGPSAPSPAAAGPVKQSPPQPATAP